MAPYSREILADPAHKHAHPVLYRADEVLADKRIRDQLSASHERFTTVLEGLDAAVSVAGTKVLSRTRAVIQL